MIADEVRRPALTDLHGFRDELAIPTLVEPAPASSATARQTLIIGSADAETARLMRIPAMFAVRLPFEVPALQTPGNEYDLRLEQKKICPAASM